MTTIAFSFDTADREATTSAIAERILAEVLSATVVIRGPDAAPNGVAAR
jgi:hypothetical protein